VGGHLVDEQQSPHGEEVCGPGPTDTQGVKSRLGVRVSGVVAVGVDRAPGGTCRGPPSIA
jgi:hypothetical protein